MTAATIAPAVERVAKSRLLWQHLQARPDQLPPDGDWSVWLILSGRGWGKTRTGAEWLAHGAVWQAQSRWAVLAPTFADARDTCVEGESGVLSVLNRYGMVKRWNRSMGELELLNGSRVKCFSADEPDRLRGPQHHGAWADELAAFRYDDAWDQLRFGLRLGDNPQTVVTTTPRPRMLLRDLATRDSTIVTRGSTFDNAANLSPAALIELKARYEGTRLGRQELFGELLEDVEGALFTSRLIDAARVHDAPPLERIIVAIDPAVTVTERSDETGIIVAGIAKGDVYVLEDRTCKASPDGWARLAIDLFYKHKADRIVAEVNNGGDLVVQTLRTVDPNVPVKKVTASRGKHVRAEPVSAMYEQGRVHHVGNLPDLEQQMTTWTPLDRESPDRLDALVWAVTDLAFTRQVAPVQSFRT